MDLIEVLWKQDVDMGFSLEQFQEEATVPEVELPPEKNKPSKPGEEPENPPPELVPEHVKVKVYISFRA
jgi:hypothetical protein